MKPFKRGRFALIAHLALVGMTSVLAAQSVACDLSPVTQQREPWTLEQFADLMGKATFHQTPYEETHVSQILTEPLLSKGTLSFTRPSRLEKHVFSPHEERYVIEGGSLLWEDIVNGTIKELLLEDYPVLLSFVEGFRAVLAGDLSTLNNWFTLNLSGSLNNWNLTLTPRDEEMIRQFVTAIRFTGKEGKITGIEIQEASGDHSILTITTERK